VTAADDTGATLAGGQPLTGRPLAGRYSLDVLLASGGMGQVWRARDLVLDRPVAVKLLSTAAADPGGGPDIRARLRAEARHGGGLSHAGIAAVYDYGEQDGEPDGIPNSAWLVMELIEGEPLSDVLRRGPLDVTRTLDVVGQAALALDAAHQSGVVHRDVKPGNLLLRPDGVVKVTDFGIAYALGAPPQPGTVVGTAYYLSPEQAAGAPVTGASDVYALGVVAYECLTGERPFPGTDPAAIAQDHLHRPAPALPAGVPAPVRDLVAAALAKDPAARPSSAGELGRTALALRAALLRSGRVAQPTPATGPVRRTRERHLRAARLAVTLLAVAAVGLGARAWLAPSDVTVPALPAGVTAAAATDLLQKAGLRVQERPGPSATVPGGRSVGTDPAAGVRVRRRTVVVLIVSSGPATGPVATGSPVAPR